MSYRNFTTLSICVCNLLTSITNASRKEKKRLSATSKSLFFSHSILPVFRNVFCCKYTLIIHQSIVIADWTHRLMDFAVRFSVMNWRNQLKKCYFWFNVFLLLVEMVTIVLRWLKNYPSRGKEKLNIVSHIHEIRFVHHLG